MEMDQSPGREPSLKEQFQATYGGCRWPYEYDQRFRRAAPEVQKSTVDYLASGAFDEERRERLVRSFDCAVGAVAEFQVAREFLKLLQPGEGRAAIANLSRRKDSEYRVLAATSVEPSDSNTWQLLSSDEDQLVRDALLANPNMTVELAEKVGPPQGFLYHSQGSPLSIDQCVEEAIKEGKLSQNYERGTRANWGSGIYRVNFDGSTSVMSTNYDSSG